MNVCCGKFYKYIAVAGKSADGKSRKNRLRQLLTENKVWFAAPSSFNDPFELHAIGNFRDIPDDSDPSVTRLKTDHSVLQHVGLQSFGVLSLTRNPINNLMWSHYADEHRGVVLGIDVNIAGFCSPETNVIPADRGEIIYTKTFPKRLNPTKFDKAFNSLRSTNSYNEELFEFFKFAFLFKPRRCIKRR